METIDIHGKNSFEKYTKTRTACRGIVIRDGQILLCNSKNLGVYMLPGGGLEPSETLTECCKRELAEETGYDVDVGDCILELNEYYEEYRFISYFYICKVVGDCEKNLTENEKKDKLETFWMPLSEAVDEFSKHEMYDNVYEEKRGIYQREFTALSVLLNNRTGEE